MYFKKNYYLSCHCIISLLVSENNYFRTSVFTYFAINTFLQHRHYRFNCIFYSSHIISIYFCYYSMGWSLICYCENWRSWRCCGELFKSVIAWETFIDPHYSPKSHTRLEVKWMQAVVTVMLRLLCKSVRNMFLSRLKVTSGFNIDVTVSYVHVQSINNKTCRTSGQLK
jgi:hypothetical protein